MNTSQPLPTWRLLTLPLLKTLRANDSPLIGVRMSPVKWKQTNKQTRFDIAHRIISKPIIGYVKCLLCIFTGRLFTTPSSTFEATFSERDLSDYTWPRLMKQWPRQNIVALIRRHLNRPFQGFFGWYSRLPLLHERPHKKDTHFWETSILSVILGAFESFCRFIQNESVTARRKFTKVFWLPSSGRSSR